MPTPIRKPISAFGQSEGLTDILQMSRDSEQGRKIPFPCRVKIA